jgi:hypothetical protein
VKARWTEKTRREWIQRRQKESAFWQLIHLLGSLRLAMVLLATIAIACAVATFYESNFNAKIAQAYIYKAPWFIFWLGLLCINLFAVTLTRWPWQKKHLGFIITHYGIIILLMGAMIGQKLGFEASVTLKVGDRPTNRLVINKTILQVDSPKDGAVYTLPLNVEVRPPTPERPQKIDLPDTRLKLLVDRYTEKLAFLQTIAPSEKGKSGVDLLFTSGMMGQSIPVTLVREPVTASSHDFFGRAKIELLDRLPERTTLTGKEPEMEAEETQVVLAQFPETPIIHARSGTPTGYHFHLTVQGSEPQVMVESPTGQTVNYPLSAMLGKMVTLPNETPQIQVKEYWPDFEMKEGKPASASDQPNNPAMLVQISGVNWPWKGMSWRIRSVAEALFQRRGRCQRGNRFHWDGLIGRRQCGRLYRWRRWKPWFNWMRTAPGKI